MIWSVKYEANMDTNDADYVESHGYLGEFDDNSQSDMKRLAMLMTALDLCSEHFDDGSCDYEDIDELADDMKRDSDLKKIVTAEEINHFCETEVGDIWDFLYDYKPRDPNDDSCAHDLYFNYTRIPSDVNEEDVYLDWITAKCKTAVDDTKETESDNLDDDPISDAANAVQDLYNQVRFCED